jgi:hypothetical protein
VNYDSCVSEKSEQDQTTPTAPLPVQSASLGYARPATEDEEAKEMREAYERLGHFTGRDRPTLWRFLTLSAFAWGIFLLIAFLLLVFTCLRLIRTS